MMGWGVLYATQVVLTVVLCTTGVLALSCTGSRRRTQAACLGRKPASRIGLASVYMLVRGGGAFFSGLL